MKIRKIHISKEELYNLYSIKKLTSKAISKIFDVSESTISVRLKEYGINTRSSSESHTLYYLSGKNKDKYINGKNRCIDCGKLLDDYNSKRCRKCHDIFNIGNNNKSFKGGKPKCKNCDKVLTNYHNKTCLNCKPQGSLAPNYIDGRTPLYFLIRSAKENKNWRSEVFKRYNFICQECGDNKGGNLNAHHIEPFKYILNKFLKDYNQLSVIEDKEMLYKLSIDYKPFWDIKNGKTLCKDCHKLEHKKLIINRRK